MMINLITTATICLLFISALCYTSFINQLVFHAVSRLCFVLDQLTLTLYDKIIYFSGTLLLLIGTLLGSYFTYETFRNAVKSVYAQYI